MKLLFLFLAMASSDGARAEKLRQATIMDRIEEQMKLPDGAQAIVKYGRNYSFLPDGRVIGVYLIPPEPSDPNEGCSFISEKGELEPCTDQDIRDMADMEREMIASQAKAGERRWHASGDEMPGILDGGCSQITIIYEEAEDKISGVACNGSV